MEFKEVLNNIKNKVPMEIQEGSQDWGYFDPSRKLSLEKIASNDIKFRRIQQKYELVNYNKGKNLWQIKALRDFGDVKAGDLGGWIKDHGSLDHNGTCWVYHNAEVHGRVERHAKVKDNAYVDFCCLITDYAEISENAKIQDNAYVAGNAKVKGNATLSDNSQIWDNVVLDDDVKVTGNSTITEDVILQGKWYLSDACISSSDQLLRRTKP